MALPTRVSRTIPSDPMELVQRDFDNLLGRLFNGASTPNGSGGRLAPYGVDIREDQDHFYVEAELPGFKKDDVDITLENQTLTITAERSEQNGRGGNGNGGAGGGGQQAQPQQAQQGQHKPQGDWLLRERRYTRFQRSFTLPPTVDESSVNARLDSGVLTITLNKREETKPRKINVN